MEKCPHQRGCFGFESQLSAKMLAQLEEHYAGSAEVTGSSPCTSLLLKTHLTAFLPYVARTIAQFKGIALDTVAKETTKNTESFSEFKIKYGLKGVCK